MRYSHRLAIKITLVLFSTSFLPITIKADPFPDPFGLSWNLSTDDLTSIGFSYDSKTGPNDQFDKYVSSSVPKPWSKGKRYEATTYKDKILKLEAQSTLITDDPFGGTGEDLYNRIVTLMTKKYGEPSSVFEGSPLGEDNPYDGINEFYQCIYHNFCTYMTFFNISDGSILVWLQATEQGAGYVTIGYESPGMGKAIDEAKNPDAVTTYADEDEVF